MGAADCRYNAIIYDKHPISKHPHYHAYHLFAVSNGGGAGTVSNLKSAGYCNTGRSAPRISALLMERPGCASVGRAIFGGLVPYGKLRTGAGHSTFIRISKPVEIGKAGTSVYLFAVTIPDVKNWTIILNKDTTLYGGWIQAGNDVVRITVPVQSAARHYESLTLMSMWCRITEWYTCPGVMYR